MSISGIGMRRRSSFRDEIEKILFSAGEMCRDASGGSVQRMIVMVMGRQGASFAVVEVMASLSRLSMLNGC